MLKGCLTRERAHGRLDYWGESKGGGMGLVLGRKKKKKST